MTDSSRDKEIELIQGLKTGDNDSFQEAVRAYTPGMLAVARFYLDHSSAEEAVQDCWPSRPAHLFLQGCQHMQCFTT